MMLLEEEEGEDLTLRSEDPYLLQLDRKEEVAVWVRAGLGVYLRNSDKEELGHLKVVA